MHSFNFLMDMLCRGHMHIATRCMPRTLGYKNAHKSITMVIREPAATVSSFQMAPGG